MNALDPTPYKVQLLKLKADTEATLAAAHNSSGAVTLDQTMVGRVSRIDAIQQQEMALAATRRQEQLLHQIDQALNRIDKGDYGYCVACDEPIAPKRLELNPVVQTCIKCAG